MKIDKVDDGVQIETPSAVDALFTIRQHPDYGFMGSVVTKDAKGDMTIVDFHGDGVDGVVVHGPQPFTA